MLDCTVGRLGGVWFKGGGGGEWVAGCFEVVEWRLRNCGVLFFWVVGGE